MSKQTTVKYLSESEVKKLLSKITDKRDYALFLAIYSFGLRVSEAVKIKISDIRLRDKRIYINASKGGVSGEQFLSKEMIKAINNLWIEKVQERKVKDEANRNRPASKQLKIDNSDYLFSSKKGGPLTTVQVFRLFRDYCKVAKIPEEKRHPHALRHSIATHLANLGRGIEEVQAHLRHRDIRNTKIYYELTDKRRSDFQAEVFDSLGI
jgi:type 1 fimbriae regulatory protein FimE